MRSLARCDRKGSTSTRQKLSKFSARKRERERLENVRKWYCESDTVNHKLRFTPLFIKSRWCLSLGPTSGSLRVTESRVTLVESGIYPLLPFRGDWSSNWILPRFTCRCAFELCNGSKNSRRYEDCWWRLLLGVHIVEEIHCREYIAENTLLRIHRWGHAVEDIFLKIHC